MNVLKSEITKEEYERLQSMSYAEQHDALFPDGLPEAWEFGYGYYGHRIYESGGKYYKAFKIGSSCD